MRTNRKIILLVALGAAAGLLSFLISQYFAGRTHSDQRLLTQIQSLAPRVEHLRLLSKAFVQNGDARQWQKITDNLQSLSVDIAAGSHAFFQWQKEIQELKIHLAIYRRLLNQVHEPALALNGEKLKLQRISLSFTKEMETQILTPYQEEAGLQLYAGHQIDPFKNRVKDVANEVMRLHLQQQLILLELMANWDLGAYQRKKEVIEKAMDRHKTQLKYMRVLMGGQPGFDNIVAALDKKMDQLVEQENIIIDYFTTLTGLNGDLIATGDLLLRASEALTAKIIVAISSTDRLNRRLSWALLVIILTGIGVVGALLARDVIQFVKDLQESRETLKESQDSLRLTQFIFDKAPIGIWKLGTDAEILDVNEQACDSLGYSREELCQMTVFDFAPGSDLEGYINSKAQLVEAGTVTVEGLHQRKNGEVFPVQVIGNLMQFEGQEYNVAFVQDITERKRSEEALREKDQLLHDIGRLVKIGAWKYDPSTGKATSTDEVARIYDFEPVQDVSVEKGLSCYHGVHREKIEHAFNEVFEKGIPYDLELEIVSAKGLRKWVRTTGYPVIKDGRVVQMQGSFQDITERRQTLDALRENEQLLNNILESMNEGLLVLGKDFKCTVFNRALGKMVELTKPDAIGKIPWESFPVLKHTPVEENIRKTMAGEPAGNLEIQLPLPSGKMAWFRDSFSCLKNADGHIVGVVGVVSDITQQKRDEAELRSLIHQLQESEARFKALHNASFGGITIHDKGLILECNQGLSEITGYSVDELIGMNGLLLFTEKSRKMVIEKIDSGYEKPYEVVGLRKNGEEFPVRLEARNIPYKGKQVRTVEFRDITEQKKAEEELRHLKNYLSNIIDSMPSVLVGVDGDGQVTQWNRQAEMLTGVRVNDAQSRYLADVFPRLKRQMDNIKAAIRERRVLQDLKVPREKQHETCYEDVTIFPLIANGVEGAVIRVDDVTGQVRLEEMMIQSEKMLSVGGLAAGMAHEVNNPLAGILQNAAVLKNRLLGDLPANHKAAEDAGTTLAAVHQYMALRKLPGMLENIRESGSRAAAIVRNMLSFARKSDRRVSTHDLGTLLDQTLELVRTDYDMKKRYDVKQIRIEREYDPVAPPVPCEAGKIQQVFMNILKNGAEAMAGVADVHDPPAFTLRIKDDDAWVQVEIEDNGPGMGEKTRRRVFEPFFTTKPVGKGTGLGLSVSYFIITEDHGGQMRTHAAEGGGTCFVIRLPKGGGERGAKSGVMGGIGSR